MTRSDFLKAQLISSFVSPPRFNVARCWSRLWVRLSGYPVFRNEARL